jgi:hypothetical protein
MYWQPFGGICSGELQKEPYHRKDLGLAPEELTLGGEGDHGGVPILPDADFLQRQRGTGDILGQGLPSLIREGLRIRTDEPAHLREQPAVVPEIRSQELGEGEDELSVGQRQQEPLVHILRE